MVISGVWTGIGGGREWGCGWEAREVERGGKDGVIVVGSIAGLGDLSKVGTEGGSRVGRGGEDGFCGLESDVVVSEAGVSFSSSGVEFLRVNFAELMISHSGSFSSTTGAGFRPNKMAFSSVMESASEPVEDKNETSESNRA